MMFRMSGAAMIAALLIGVSALAQDASEPRQPGDSPVVEKKASNRPLRGEILAVDIEAKTLTVQSKKGSEQISTVVETGPQTQFVLDQNPATLVDLRKGMRVVVLPDVGTATKVQATTVKQPPKRTEGRKAKAGSHGESAAESSGAASKPD